MKKKLLLLIPAALIFSLLFFSCPEAGSKAIETKETVLFENGEWTSTAGGDGNVEVGADVHEGTPGGIMFEFASPINATGYDRFIIVFKTAPDMDHWDGGELQSHDRSTGWVEGVWSASARTATLKFSAQGQEYDPSKPFNPAILSKVIFKGGGPTDNDPIWTMDDIEKVAIATVVGGFCDICFYEPCKCDDLCWRCGFDLKPDRCICMCGSCGQKVCSTTPPVLPSYYPALPDGAVWLGCYEEDSDIQFRWIISSDIKKRIQDGELNKLILYVDADAIGTNTTPAGRVGTVVMAINATRTSSAGTWQTQSPAFNYTGVQANPTNIKNTGPLTYYLNHSPEYDSINWAASAMFQIYIQCTASQGRIEGLHFIAGFLAYDSDAPQACEDCEKIICICDKPRPYELGGSVGNRWTWDNPASSPQLGHQFGTAWGDPSFTSFSRSRYMVFEVLSNNATHVPGLRIIFLGSPSGSTHSGNTIYSRTTPFINPLNSTYYVVIELERITQTNSVNASGTGVSAWDQIKAGTFARFYLQDGWQARVQNVWLLDTLVNENPSDKTVLTPGAGWTWTSSGGGSEVPSMNPVPNDHIPLTRDLPAFVTADRASLGLD